jgi:hypothetical protein
VKEYVCDDDYKPLIPNGTYTVQCINYDNKFCLGKSRKLFLTFKILEGEHQGKKIFQAFNMPYNGRIRTGSKYFKTWCMVNNWQNPSRNAKMSPRIFLNKIYTVKTRTVKPLHDKREMPECFFYSVVDEIKSVDSGKIL